MNWIVFHIASGQAFFTGSFLVLLAVTCSCFEHPIPKRATSFAFIMGVIAILVSTTPIPYWMYAMMVIASIAWITSAFIKPWRIWCRIGLAGSCLLGLAFEIPYHISWDLDPTSDRTLTVIADSITAGIGDYDSAERWPSLIAKEHALVVQDISHPGETSASALSRANQVELTGSIILVEIGGNDLLGSTSSSKFQKDLDALLSHVCQPGRQVVMFELPLPPMRHEYGRIQRLLAAKHDVSLVPKRKLLGVLAGKDSTLDTVHLTQRGHEQMSHCVWGIIDSAFPASGN